MGEAWELLTAVLRVQREEALAARRALFGEEHLDTRRAQRLVDGLRT